jgi:phosphoglycerate kinase
MAQFLTLDDGVFKNKTVLVRVDLNVPMQDGQVTDITRIVRLLPTITHLIHHHAKVVLLSHFGRPKGQRNEKDSLQQLLPALSKVFGQKVLFINDCVGPQVEMAVKKLEGGQILLLENLRFHAEEEINDPDFAKALASLGDVYVNDAFSCSHRAHASVVAITKHLPAFAGRGMQQELETLSNVLENPKRPLMAIVAGSKVSTKLDLLKNLIQKVDYLVVGGGMANTFLKAQGISIGQSLYEESMLDTARTILQDAKTLGCDVVLPKDVAVTTDIKSQENRSVVPINSVQSDEKIVDVGEATIEIITQKLSSCATVVWNGPVGIFEIPPFDRGSTALAKRIAEYTQVGRLISVAGGGDTLAALAHAGCENDLTYTSTAGGAFLEWLEGKILPGVEALRIKNSEN